MKFTIRDLLWMTVVVALGVGSWLDRKNSADERARVQRLAADLDLTAAEIRLQMAQLLEAQQSQPPTPNGHSH